MSDSEIHSDTARPPGPQRGGSLNAALEALDALDALPSSTEPAVVFTSLVRLCVPALCEVATATIVGPAGKVYAVNWPRDEMSHHRASLHSVTAHFETQSSSQHDDYHGRFSLRFGSSSESQPLLARLLVEGALARVERARLAETAAAWRDDASQLRVALTSNREISVAVGILMARHDVTADEGFDALLRVSQEGGVSLEAVAVEVIRTGTLQLPDSSGTRPRPAS